MNPQYIVLGAIEASSRIIEFSPRTLFEWSVQTVNLLVIIGFLSWILFKPVSEFLSDRKEGIKDKIDNANSRNKEAKELKLEYESKLAKVQEEATQILTDARNKAIANKQVIVNEARNEAEQIRKRSQAEIELEQARVEDDIRKEMIEIASLMASEFVTESMDKKKQDELINKIIDEAGDVQWLN